MNPDSKFTLLKHSYRKWWLMLAVSIRGISRPHAIPVLASVLLRRLETRIVPRYHEG